MEANSKLISTFFALLSMGLVACSAVSQEPSTVGANRFSGQIVVDLGWDKYDGFRRGFDPTLGWSYSNPLLFQSTLLSRNEKLELVNDLAQSYSISSDRKVWKFNIRKDARFTDGQPLTAEDVAYTYNKTKDSPGHRDLRILERAIATSKHSVELHLKQPQITFTQELTTLGIVPKHAHNKNYPRNPIGSGPYRLVQWVEGEQVVIEANPNYYGEKPKIKRVVFLFSRGDAAFAAARAGQVHVADVPYSLAPKPIEGMTLYRTKSVGHAGLMFPYPPNTGKKTPQGYPIGNDVTSDLAIRRAVNYAIDRKVLVNSILEGNGSPATGPADGMPWFEPTAAIGDADIDKARQILAEAGWKDTDGDRILDKGGLKAEFKLLYAAQDAHRQGLALAVAQMVKPVGIRIIPEGRNWTEIERRMQSNTVLYMTSNRGPQQLHFYYKSTEARGKSQNPGYYANPVVDAAIDAAMTSQSEQKANVFWRQVQWNGQTGVTTKGDAASAWMVNFDKTYFVSNCLDIGKNKEQSNRYRGSIFTNLPQWQWICQ
ncbi:MAG: ABC transporter substrate-binding protein [Scytonema sp. PMC 1069.18]|nr:ABC transporter substrate-binding protein [Scytonema sp. PMC 1069.18]MEC4881433.1 ABC transporter substrate-binding protein [Scytonema sp. PMC 1070.18]